MVDSGNIFHLLSLSHTKSLSTITLLALLYRVETEFYLVHLLYWPLQIEILPQVSAVGPSSLESDRKKVCHMAYKKSSALALT